MRYARTAAAVVAASILVLGVAAPAATAAGRAEVDHWTEHTDVARNGPDNTTFCIAEDGSHIVPFPVQWVEDLRGFFHGVVRQGEFYGQDSIQATGSYTNTDNGLAYSYRSQWQTRDHVVTENDDGTFTITAFGSGTTSWYGPDGEFMFRDAGRGTAIFVVTADGDFIELLDADSVGRTDTEGRDFCDDLVEFLS